MRYCPNDVDALLADCGCQVTFTVQERVNALIRGKPKSLRMLGRFDMQDDLSPEELPERISS